MTSWIYFVLIAELIWAFTSFIDKIVISKGYIKNPLVYIVLNGLMNILLIFLLPFVAFEPLNFLDFLIALFSGAVFTAGVVFYYKAVEQDEISRVLVLFQLIPVFVLILSFLFLGEILTKNHFIGFIFLLSAGTVISYRKIENSFKLSKSFYYMVISTFLVALAYISQKYILNVTSFWSGFLWIRLTSFTALYVLFVPSIRNQFAGTFKIMKNEIKVLLIFKMIIDFSAFIFLGLAVLNGPISLVSALGSASAPLFIFLITLFTSIYLPRLVREEITNKIILVKLLAIVLIVTGIIFINL